MPIAKNGRPARPDIWLPNYAQNLAANLLREFPKIPAIQIGKNDLDLRKHWRTTIAGAHGWYARACDRPEQWTNDSHPLYRPQGSYYWARNTLLNNGIPWYNIFVTTTFIDPDGERTMGVFRVEVIR